MFEHLRYHSARVEPRGPAGDLAEKILILNDSDSVNYRELILGFIKLAEDKKRQLEQSIRKIEEVLRSGTGDEELLRNKKLETETDYKKMVQYLSMLGGAQ